MSAGSVKRVLVVDDSVTVCRFLTSVFQEDPELDVVGHALNALEARDKIKQFKPDVITLDVEMPGMDGLTFLKNLMRLNPLPVVMFSSLTEVGASATLDALAAGAVDFMPKRSNRDGVDLEVYVRELRERVKVAASANQVKKAPADAPVNLPELKDVKAKVRSGKSPGDGIHRLIALGASTGGPEALRQVLKTLKTNSCSLVISQHMPGTFVDSFTKRMNAESEFEIGIAKDGEKLVKGRGYVCPGENHLVLAKLSDGLHWKLNTGDKVSGHRPSVNVLFDSIVKAAPQSTVAALLTGMGDDGAEGLLRLRQAGCATFAQDKKSSVVWGMPGRAVALNAADSVLDLYQVGPALNEILS